MEQREAMAKALLLNGFEYISRDYGDEEVWVFEKEPEFNEYNEFTAVRKSSYALLDKKYKGIDSAFDLEWINPGEVYHLEKLDEPFAVYEEVPREDDGTNSNLMGMLGGAMGGMMPPMEDMPELPEIVDAEIEEKEAE